MTDQAVQIVARGPRADAEAAARDIDAHPVLEAGHYAVLKNSNGNVFSWSRILHKGKTAWVAVNLSGEPQSAVLSSPPHMMAKRIFGNGSLQADSFTLNLPPYGVGVWESE